MLRQCSLASIANVASLLLLVLSIHSSHGHDVPNDLVLSPKLSCACASFGDPHYSTFDQYFFSFQGVCNYLMTETKLPRRHACYFKIIENNRKAKEYSVTEGATIFTHDDRIEIGPGRVASVNGKKVEFPHKDHDFTISRIGREVVYDHPACRYRVSYDGFMNLKIEVSESYKNKMNGLCGNCDGDKFNDLKKRDGSEPTGKNNQVKWDQVGNSFVELTPQSPKHCVPKNPINSDHPCTGAWKTKVLQYEYCGILSADKSPFKQCFDKFPHFTNDLLKACRFDICTTADDPKTQRIARCEILNKLRNRCHRNGFKNIHWRTKTGCQLTCGKNEKFGIIKPCQKTCQDLVLNRRLSAACAAQNSVEGCACVKGHVRQGHNCVSPCQCMHLAFVNHPNEVINIYRMNMLVDFSYFRYYSWHLLSYRGPHPPGPIWTLTNMLRQCLKKPN